MKRSLLSAFVISGLAGALFGQTTTPPAAPTYNVITVGGSISNVLGDGGIAAGAALLAPVDVVVDAAGNIYISDSFSNSGRIRKIDSTGNISTLTTVTSDPTGIFLDASGKFLYVADNGNHRIRKVDTTSGATTTYAGTGSADLTDYGCVQCTDPQTKHLATQIRMRNPRAVWVDANGNVYFTDTQNSRVSRVDAASGVITQVAGRGQANTTVALPTGTTNGQSNAFTTLNVAGDGGLANQATLANPEGIVGDNKGNIYIADTNFNRIRKVNLSSGIITTIAGLGTSTAFNDVGDPTQAQFNLPKGLAIDAAGANLYIADSGNNRIRRLNLASCTTGLVNGVLTTTPAGCGVLTTVVGGGSALGDGGPGLAATLNNPTGVNFDAAGNMYIADQGNGRVRVLDAGNGLLRTIAGGNQGRGDGSQFTFATFSNPRGVAVDTAGNIYVSDTNNQKIRKISASGVVSTVVGTGTSGNTNLPPAPIFNLTTTVPPTASTNAQVSFPGCVAVDPAGDLFVADRANNKIRRVDPSGNISDLVRSNSLSLSRTGATIIANAAGYNGDGGAAVADRFGLPTNGGFLSSGLSTNTNGPNCVTVDNNGNVYIADTGNNVIRKVDPNGNLSTVVGYQTILCADKDAASGNSVNVPCSSPLAAGSPVATGVAGSEGDGGLAVNAQLNSPRGLGVDPSGRYLCIADTGNHAVRQVNLQTGIIITLAGIIPDGGSDTLPANGWQSRLSGPQGCAMDAALNTYIADTGNSRITFVTPAGVETVIAGGGSTFGGDGKAATATILNAPVGITVDAQGNVYFTDRLGLIRELTVVK